MPRFRDDDRLVIRPLGEREQEAMRLIEQRPGITVGELRAALGVTESRTRKVVDRLHAGRVRVERPPLPEPADIEPPITARELPREVELRRVVARNEDERVSALMTSRIDGHVAAYGMALDTMEEVHQRIADRTDIDLEADTRWAAMWQTSGRCIGYARALLVLARAGFGDEALPIARSLHECDRLLEALGNRYEQQIVTEWLADDDNPYVRPRDARNAVERGERIVANMMRTAGEEPIPNTRSLTTELYHRMSVVSHNRRQATQSVVSTALRRMSRGRHPNPYARAEAVLSLGAVVEEAVSHVGLSLSMWHGPTNGPAFLRDAVRPTLGSFEAVRRDMPLDEASLRAAVSE